MKEAACKIKEMNLTFLLKSNEVEVFSFRKKMIIDASALKAFKAYNFIGHINISNPIFLRLLQMYSLAYFRI